MVTKGSKAAAVMCILRAGDDFLLLERGKEPNLGKYVPVGGHVDPHETPRHAAIREVQEETGYVADDVRFCGVLVETSPRDYNWVVFVYFAEVETFSPTVCDEGTLEWVPLSHLAQIPTPTTDMHIYQLVAEGLPFVLNAEYDQNLRLLLLQDEITGEVLHHEG
jgi:8-oxo-dGTP diphosphatase